MRVKDKAVIMSVTCPQCDVPAGWWCVTPAGKRAISLHGKRIRLAGDEGKYVPR